MCDVNGDGVVDRTDINLIVAARGATAAGHDDPRDVDGDGKITLTDAQKCTELCTLAGCARVVKPIVVDLQPKQLTIASGDTGILTLQIIWPPRPGRGEQHEDSEDGEDEDGPDIVSVRLRSSMPAIVSVPSQITVPAGVLTAHVEVSAVGLGGPVTITATLNNTSASASVTVARGPPPPVIAEPLVDGSTVVGGQGIAGAVVDVQVDGVSAGSGAVAADGTFRVAVPRLQAGAVVRATQTLAGLVSALSSPVTVHAIPPAPTLTPPLVEQATGVSGTGSPGALVRIFVGGVTAGTGTVGSNGSFSITVAPLVAGQQVAATQTVDGIESIPSAPLTVVMIPPPPIITTPLVAGAVTVGGTATARGTVEVFIDGASIGTTAVTTGGTWSLVVPALAVGSKVKARQVVSGISSAFSVEILVIAAPPPPEINLPLVATATSVSGAAVAGALVTVFVDHAAVGNAAVAADGHWSLALGVALSIGQIVEATQAIGGVASIPSAPATVIAPPPAPVINGPVVAGSTSVSGAGTTGASVTVFVDGVAVGSVAVGVSGTWTLALAVPLSSGQVIQASQTFGGVVSAPSEAVTVISPTPPPTVHAGLVAGDTTIMGTGLNGASVEVFVDSQSIGTTSVNPDLTWSLPVAALKPGQVVTATQTAAGFVSPRSDPVVVGAAVLRQITLTPSPTGTVVRGQTLQFRARGTFSDQSVQDPLPSVTWKSDRPAVLSINIAGLATGNSAGTAAVTATRDGIASAATNVTVRPPAPSVATPLYAGLTAVSGAGDAGASVQVFVNGIARGAPVAVGSTGQWTSDGLAALAANDLVTAQQTVNGIVSDLSPAASVGPALLTHIDINPAPVASVIRGRTLPFSAQGIFSDGSAQPLSNVTWSSTSPNVATIDATGLATGKGAGTTQIQASRDGIDSASTTLTVKPSPTTTTLTAPDVTSPADGIVVVAVSSVDAPAGTPIGGVVLSVDHGTAQSQPLDATGKATFTIARPDAGVHTLSVTYATQGDFDGSSTIGSLTVKPAPTTTAIAAPNVTYPMDGTVTVTVAAVDRAAGTPTGNMTLSVDGGAAQARAVDAAGTATFAVTKPTGGDHGLSASYVAQGNFDASGATGTLHVSRADTSTTARASQNPADPGQSITFTATVTSGAEKPTGSVTFQDASTNTTTTVALDSAGQATLTTSALAVGSHSIVAAYSGDTNFNASTSGTLSEIVDTAPATGNDAYTTLTNVPLVVAAPGVLANDSDVDASQVLTVIVVQGPQHADQTRPDQGFTLNGNGSFSYTPAADFTGRDGFTYTAFDGLLNSQTATVTITVVAPGAMPVSANDAYRTAPGPAQLIVPAPGVLSNDNGAIGHRLTAVLVSGPAHADPNSPNAGFTLNGDGSFSYTPAASFTGTDSFTYRAHDVASNVDSPNLAMVTITVQSASASPAAASDTYLTNSAYITDENSRLSVGAPGILANDTPDSGLRAELVSGPLYGSLTDLNGPSDVAPGSFVYTPATHFSGVDSFTYRATDGTSHSNLATVTILVRAATRIGIGAPAVAYPSDGTVTVTVASDAGMPTGDVSLSVEGGSSTPKTLDSNGQAVFAVLKPGAGNRRLSASYAAQGGFAASTALGTLKVDPAATRITIAAPDVTYATDGTVRVTVAAANGAAGTPTGDVTLSVDGGAAQSQPLDATGTATFTVTKPNVGSHTLSASYAAQGNFDQSAATGTLTVTAPVVVALRISPESPTANVGDTLQFRATATLSNNATEDRTAVVTWTSDTSLVATITAGGLASARSEGHSLITATDPGGLAASTTLTVVVPTPPDPSTVAPPIDRSTVTTMVGGTEFLYTGPNPIQTGVAAGTIDPRRVAVLRGRVTTREGAALPAVAVAVLNHPELGRTLSRADGMFDLAVNGGGPLTVTFTRNGYLPAQRQVQAPWQDYVFLPEVALIPLDAQVSAIDLTSSAPIQVARGTRVSDGDGARQATLLFPRGTAATMVFPDGSTRPITALSVRATEYTVGPSGPTAMPAELPPTSAYTYAFVLTADEARAAGAIDVRFSQPIPFYVENFLNFPVGIEAPLGAYDPGRGVWVPSDSGRVVRIVSVSGGLANLDTTGTGTVDNGAALGVTDAERQQLAALYQPGQSLWRVVIPHFDLPWDINWPFSCPEDCVFPASPAAPDQSLDTALSCQQGGSSIIECQNQILREALPVVGTRFGLHYQSERVPGRRVANTLEIPLSGDKVPASLLRIRVEIRIAGRFFEQGFSAAPNQQTTFTWDGKDAYGRTLQGAQPVTVRIGYAYRGVYQKTPRFGSTGGGAITGVFVRQEITFWQEIHANLGVLSPTSDVGGWTLSAHHAYDPTDKVLFLGDGQRRSAQASGDVITTIAGNGAGFGGDGGPATQAGLPYPQGVAVAPDASFYVSEYFESRVRRVAPNGIITTVVGTGTPGFSGDGGPATQARLGNPQGVAVAPDGSLYIADYQNFRVRRVGRDGIITTVAGTGTAGFSGDGGPATQAMLDLPLDVAAAPDGSFYIADYGNSRVRRVGPDGIITTVAGSDRAGFSGDGGLATQARLSVPHGVAVTSDGSFYIADSGNRRVRRVGPDGIITTVAGSGTPGFGGDGGPATQAQMFPIRLAVARDGSIFIAGDNRIRQVTPDGIITTVAGSDKAGFGGDGGVATQAQLLDPEAVAVAPDGNLYIADVSNARIRRVAKPLPEFSFADIGIASASGSELYRFNASGRHLQTLDAFTGAVRYQFAYDNAGRLATITDANGNVTAIERDVAGGATAIVGPFGQRTALVVNADGYLGSITNLGGDATQLTYTPDGLLTSLTKPRGQTSRYAYDTVGRLTSATDPIGAAKTLARTGTNKDSTVTVTSALGRATAYHVELLTTGDIRLTTTDPAGTRIQTVIRKDGSRTTTYPDGTVVSTVLGPDPRWGMQAPVATSLTVSTPGGKVQTTTTQRTATLASPVDPLSLRTFSERVSVNGRVFTRTYDAASRTFTLSTPTGRHRTVVVDDRGRPVQTQVGDLAPISHTYDARGRLTSATQGVGTTRHITSFVYGTDGLLASVTDSTGRTATLTHDANGRVIAQMLADGRVLSFTYDRNGNRTALTPPGQPAHSFAYTERDQLAAYTAPVVGTQASQTLYNHDEERRPVSIDLPDGQSVGFLYDAAGRISALALTSGNRTYAYDTANRLTSLGTPAVSLAFGYDSGLRTGETWSGAVAGSVTRTYDNDFRVASLGVDAADPIVIQYDTDSRPIQVGALSLTRAATTGLVTATSLGSITDARTYDPFGAPASSSASFGATALYSASFTRDSLGRVTGKTETIDGATSVFAYSYDLAGRLTQVSQNGTVVASYAYDANGNRLSRADGAGAVTAGSYDAQDRLLQYGSTTYAYSPNGQLLSKTTGGQVTSYQYDTPGNLVAASLPDRTAVTYLLDGRARRVGKIVNGTLVQGLLYQDSLRPIAELDGAGNVVSRFVYASRFNVPDYLVKGGKTYRIIADQLGSPRLVVDAATGAITQRIDYDEFGNVLRDTNPGFQPFGFAGGLYDPDSKLVRFGARDYEAAAGRWTSKDPLRFGGGDTNLYGYALGDPVNHIDVAGLGLDTLSAACVRSPQLCQALAAAGAGGAVVAAEAEPEIMAAVETAAPAIEQACSALANTIQSASPFADTVLATANTVQSVVPQAPSAADELAAAGQLVTQYSAQYQTLLPEEVEDIPLLEQEFEINIERAFAEDAAPNAIRRLFDSMKRWR